MEEKKILLVEDEKHLAKGLTFNLKREGYQVTLAEDGVAAIDCLGKDEFDMMILDLMLPKMSGMEVIKKVRETNIRFPVLILTAKSTDEDRTFGLEAGADDYLTKPFHLPELLLRVKAILRRKDWYEEPVRNLEYFEFDNMWVDFKTGKAMGCEGEFYLTTKEVLVRTLKTFEGTMLFVSHDRTFLRGLANKVLDLSGGGEGTAGEPLVFHGDYQSWVERTGHEAPGVHR